MKAWIDVAEDLLAQKKTARFGMVGALGAFLGSVVGYRLFGDGSLPRIAGWDAFIGLGIGMAIALAQEMNLRRVEVRRREVQKVAVRCALGGAAGGTALVIVKSLLGGLSGHVAGWAAEGLVMAILIARVLPNLPLRDAAMAGTIGGALGGLLSLFLGPLFPSAVGVALADALKGAMLGIALSASERLRAASSASLLIHWGKGETSLVLLGGEPILFGSTADCRVYVRGSPDAERRVFAEALIVDGRVVVRDLRRRLTSHLKDGESFRLEGVQVEVCIGRDVRAPGSESRGAELR